MAQRCGIEGVKRRAAKRARGESRELSNSMALAAAAAKTAGMLHIETIFCRSIKREAKALIGALLFAAKARYLARL